MFSTTSKPHEQRASSHNRNQETAAAGALDKLEANLPCEPGRAVKREKKITESIGAAAKATDDGDDLKPLLDGVDSLVGSLPVLVRTLELVAELHPFLAVAVDAFKVAIELEAKRRDNDQKIRLLFLEMRNMMSALLELQKVRADHVGNGGSSIKARLGELAKKTAKDIEECANVCNTYCGQRLLAKVFKAPSWDGKLKEYIQLFVNRKGEFRFYISIHTGLGIDRNNEKLDVLDTKIDMVIAFFEKTLPSEQRALSDVIQCNGGPNTVRVNADVLRVLLLMERGHRLPALGGSPILQPPPFDAEAREDVPMSAVVLYPKPFNSVPIYLPSAEDKRMRRPPDVVRVKRGEYGLNGGRPYGFLRSDLNHFGKGPSPNADVWQLMQDLEESPEVAIQKNLVWFARVFAMQLREFGREIKRAVVHEGDRVISSVLAGPHERIVDPELYEIWKDMRWRGIVKARHLVLGILDHYTQKLEGQERAIAQQTTVQNPISEHDLWALKCLQLMHLQQIIEAIDTDASGFITIQEVNDFTTSRPPGWSLLHWLAYWACGWQETMSEYRRKIHVLLARMNEFRTTVRARQPAVDQYLGIVVPIVKAMTTPFREDPEPCSPLAPFRIYMEEQEKRLHEEMEKVEYDINSLREIKLINGPKGLEKNLFVILYLLLRRHYDIMAIGTKVVLHPEELSDAVSVLQLAQDAYEYRKQDLSALFAQRRLAPSSEFIHFACGMFSSPSYPYTPDHDPHTLVHVGELHDLDLGETREAPSEMALKYPPHFEDFYPASWDEVNGEGTEISEELKPLLGHWVGVRSSDVSGVTHHFPSVVFDFHISPSDRNQVIAVPLLMRPWTCTRTTVTGTFAGVNEENRSTFVLSESYNTSALPDTYSKVVLSEDGMTLTGEQDTVLSFDTPGPKSLVVLKRGSSPEIMQFYPRTSELQDNKARALWSFALSAILREVRRRRFSWGYIKERRDRVRLLASLFHAESRRGLLHPDDAAERARLVGETTPADLHYVMYATVEPARLPWLLPWCVECKRVLRTVLCHVYIALCARYQEVRLAALRCATVRSV